MGIQKGNSADKRGHRYEKDVSKVSTRYIQKITKDSKWVHKELYAEERGHKQDMLRNSARNI